MRLKGIIIIVRKRIQRASEAMRRFAQMVGERDARYIAEEQRLKTELIEVLFGKAGDNKHGLSDAFELFIDDEQKEPFTREAAENMTINTLCDTIERFLIVVEMEIKNEKD